MDSNIQKLRFLIEEQLGWGNSASWQGRDFEKLSELVFEHTRVKLSDSTLKRIWGKVSYQSLPSTTTLDALAQFTGFENWRSFVKKQTSALPKKAEAGIKTTKLQPGLIGGILVAVAIITIFHSVKLKSTIAARSGYSFSIKTLSHTIPGSVVFNYDASAAGDSVFIQHPWDKSGKTPVDKNEHTYTEIHYEPGFYHPQLVVGKQVVKTIDLMIRTNGWMGWIADGPTPVYLDSTDYLHPDKLELPVTKLIEKDPALELRPPYTRYYNVGNFGNVSVGDFSFSAQVKSGYKRGAAACQFISVQLITDRAPIVIPVSTAGCVSELTLLSFDQRLSGKNTDLSGFGTDPSSWVTISCQNTAKTIRYFVDGRLAFESPAPAIDTKIVGIGFSFQGTGAVRQVILKEGGKFACKDF